MSILRSDGKLFLLSAIILIFLPIFLVKANFLKTTYVYSGLIKDASNGAPSDLIKVRVGNKITYSDFSGRYAIKLESLPVMDLFGEKNLNEIDVIPTYQFEPSPSKIICSKAQGRWLTRLFDCSGVLYPQVFEMASRVMATEAVGGLQKEYEIRARKSSLWDLLAVESQNLWATREEFAGFLTLKEMTQVKLLEQVFSFKVSRQPTFINSYEYLGKTNLEGELAKVEVSVVDARSRTSTRFLYFKKESGLWKFLFEETPKSIAAYTTTNAWVLKRLKP